MGWTRQAIGLVAVAATLCVACADQAATDGQSSDSNPTPSPSGLPLAMTGAILHDGNYCHFLQTVVTGNNTLPVTQGCQFNLTVPADVLATDGSNYSVSEVVGEARLAVRGPADSKVMIACRLSPRAQFWFWVSDDGHWNISNVADVHHPQDLVSAQDEESLRQYVKTGGVQNDLQFKCAGGLNTTEISLAVNINYHQFAAVSVAMPAGNVPLDRPQTPWFVDVGARLLSPGTLEGTVAAVTLYDRE